MKEQNYEIFLNSLLTDSKALSSPIFYQETLEGYRPIKIDEFIKQIAHIQSQIPLSKNPNQVAAIILDNSIEWEYSEKACLLNGFHLLGIETQNSQQEVQDIINQFKPAIIICSDKIMKMNLETGALLYSFKESENKTNLLQLLSNQELEEKRVKPLKGSEHSSRAKLIVLTSGTTGKRKAPTYEQWQVLESARSIVKIYFRTEPGSIPTICWMPMAGLFQKITNLCALIHLSPCYITCNPKMIMTNIIEINPVL